MKIEKASQCVKIKSKRPETAFSIDKVTLSFEIEEHLDEK